MWPKWIPYLRSIFRAFALGLLSSGVAAVTYILGFWSFILAAFITNDQNASSVFGLWLIAILGIVPALLIASVHHLLWGKPYKKWPSWIPTPKSLWAGFYGWVVILLATVLTLLVCAPFWGDNYQITETEASWFSFLWLVFAAYLYQVEQLLRTKKHDQSQL